MCHISSAVVCYFVINNLQSPNVFSERCRNTLRGHTDSVNSIEFLPFSNTLCTCSADKTISLWDARTGLCAQTLYEHQHAINHVSFNLQVSGTDDDNN